MKIMKVMRYTGLLLLMICTWPAIAQENTAKNQGFVVDEIIAKVDNYIVLKSELDKAYQDYLTGGGSPSQNVRCQYLALLIRNKLMMAKAEIDSVTVSDAEVDANAEQRMNMILSQSNKPIDEIEALYGKTIEQMRIELRDQIKEQMVVGKMQSEITKDVKITPAEVRKFFNGLDSLPYFSAAVELGQIVKIAKVSAEQESVTKAQLVDIRNQILSGADFSTLAKKYSTDPSVMGNGGNMGWVGRGKMVPEYEAMAFKLKPNEISMPFRTTYGFHIMQLLERRGSEYNSRHILIAPTPSENDLKNASRYLDSIRTLILRDSIKFQKAAKEFSDDVATKGNGGLFNDETGGTHVMMDELDQFMYFQIDSMKIGSISKPLAYRTDDGKDAVRILYYKSRISPHEASLDQDWSRIQEAALNEKKDGILQRWFQKARKDVFISIDPSYDYCGILDEK